MVEWGVLIVAAFLAGVLNTIAGGGTFLTFPALVFAGLPPVAANATSAFAVLPGYLSGTLGFSKELKVFDRKQLLRLTIWTVIGGLIGAILLMISSNKAFSGIVPFLLLAATMIFIFSDQLRTWATKNARSIVPFGITGLVIFTIYGGYFNGGLGIVLLALFALWGMTDIHQMNGLKNGLSFALSLISVVAFAVGGLVAWPQAFVMMGAATVGGYAGAPIARALPRAAVRWLVIVVGFGMSAIFLARLIGG